MGASVNILDLISGILLYDFLLLEACQEESYWHYNEWPKNNNIFSTLVCWLPRKYKYYRFNDFWDYIVWVTGQVLLRRRFLGKESSPLEPIRELG